MPIKNLKDLFISELQDAYSAETQLTEALPKMADAAANPELKAAFNQHLRETEGQVKRLGQIADMVGCEIDENTCEAMEGLINETEHMLSKDMTPEVCDAAIIACAQRIEHYEMAGYGTVRAYAEALKMQDDVNDLSRIFKQEESADSKLNRIAMDTVNRAAMNGQTRATPRSN